VPWLGGLTSGAAALVVNTVVHVTAACLMPHSAAERARVDALFTGIDDRSPDHLTAPAPLPTR